MVLFFCFHPPPLGIPVFRGISALDRDKPGTPNSQISYEIVGGNAGRKFSLEARSKASAVLVLRRGLDYDEGDREFNVTVRATVRKKEKALLYMVSLFFGFGQ